MNQQLLILAILWASFYALHSTLAHNSVKNFFEKLFGNHFRFYRLAFNFISIVFFVALISFQFSIEKVNLFEKSLFTEIVGAGLILAGIILLITAFKAFNLKEFTGIEQLENKAQVDQKHTPVLVKKGMYAYVRHPLYFAIIILLTGALIFLPYTSTLAFVVVSFIYLPIGVKLEEEKLIKEFGEQYIQYKKEVKMLIPYVF